MMLNDLLGLLIFQVIYLLNSLQQKQMKTLAYIEQLLNLIAPDKCYLMWA